VGLAVRNVYRDLGVVSTETTPNGHPNFSGIKMKISLKETGALGILRCPEDSKELLIFHDDDITLQNCEHYRWHAAPDETGLEVSGEDKEEDEEDEEELDERDWYEILRQNHVAAVSFEGTKFYLIRLEKAVGK